jgi:hypothetical protein
MKMDHTLRMKNCSTHGRDSLIRQVYENCLRTTGQVGTAKTRFTSGFAFFLNRNTNWLETGRRYTSTRMFWLLTRGRNKAVL